MNKLLKLLGIGAIALASLGGCKEYKLEKITKHEDAIVRAKLFVREYPGMNGRQAYPGVVYKESMAGDGSYIFSYEDMHIQIDRGRLPGIIQENNLYGFFPLGGDKRPRDNSHQPITHNVPLLMPEDKYYVFFDGDVDFEVENKGLYIIFRLGNKANVTYKEVYLLTYDDVNDDGEKELIKKSFLGNSFRNAQPKLNN